MLIKQESLLLPRNLALVTFGDLLIVFSTKVNLLYFLYLMAQRCCDKANLFVKKYSDNYNLDESGISLPAFPDCKANQLTSFYIMATLAFIEFS